MKRHALVLICLSSPFLFQVNPVRASAPTLTVQLASSNTLNFHSQTTNAALVLQSSTDLKSWLDEKDAPATNGAVQFQNQPEGFAGIFFRVRSASAAETANPLSVSASANPNLIVSNLITGAGGSLALTNDSGTVFRLNIPGGALAGFALVTMQVVDSLGGAPLSGGFGGGVSLQPAGLWFYNQATLTITRTNALPGPNPVGFAWEADGSNFHLVPFTATSTQAVFGVETLKNFGVGGASANDLTNLASHPPSQLADQFAHAVALDFIPGGPSLPAGKPGKPIPGDNALTRLEQRVTTRWNSTMASMNEAFGNQDAVDSALGDLNSWVFLYNSSVADDPQIGTDLSAEHTAALDRGHDLVVHWLETDYALCGNHDLHQIANLITCGFWANSATLASEFTPTARDQYRTYVENCAHFEFEMQSDTQFTIQGLGSGEVKVQTHIPVMYQLTVENALTTVSTVSPADVLMAQVTSPTVEPPCSYVGPSLTGGSMAVLSLDLGLNTRHSRPPPPLRVSVVFQPFAPAFDEQFTVTCPFVGSLPYHETWGLFFTLGHTDQVPGPMGPAYLFQDWQVHPGAEGIATLSAPANVALGSGAGNDHEVTDFTLHHTPVH